MTVSVELAGRAIDAGMEIAQLGGMASGAGAVVTFAGLVRPETKAGEQLEALVLESHPRMTLQSMQAIAADAARRFDTLAIRVVHRHGAMVPGETIVFVGVAGAHRRAAFEAADYLMDRLKTEAVFWKREEGAFGRRWIEPTQADAADRQRWLDDGDSVPPSAMPTGSEGK